MKGIKEKSNWQPKGFKSVWKVAKVRKKKVYLRRIDKHAPVSHINEGRVLNPRVLLGKYIRV